MAELSRVGESQLMTVYLLFITETVLRHAVEQVLGKKKKG